MKVDIPRGYLALKTTREEVGFARKLIGKLTASVAHASLGKLSRCSSSVGVSGGGGFSRDPVPLVWCVKKANDER